MNLGSQQCWTKLCLTWSPATPEMFRDEAENVTGSPPAWVWLPLEAVSPVFTPGTLRSATVAGVTSVTRTQPAGASVLSGHRATSTSLRELATLPREYPPLSLNHYNTYYCRTHQKCLCWEKLVTDPCEDPVCSRKLEGECSPEQPGPTFEETGYYCNQ